MLRTATNSALYVDNFESEGAMFMLSLFLFLSGAGYDWSGDAPPSMYPQPPMLTPYPVYQPWDYDMSAASGQLHGNPSLMMSSQAGSSGSQTGSLECHLSTYPLTVPHGSPPSVPGDTALPVPWSTCDL